LAGVDERAPTVMLSPTHATLVAAPARAASKLESPIKVVRRSQVAATMNSPVS
jgi:hypothetical protein